METRITLNVTRIAFNRLLPCLVDIDGQKLTTPVTDELDAVGYLEVRGLDGSVTVAVFYGRDDD